MLSREKIINAVNICLLKALPDMTVYINICPIGFVRPSLLLQVPVVQSEDVNFCTVQQIYYFTIIYHGTVDEYAITDAEELYMAGEKIMNCFKNGYITVEDRALRCTSTQGEMDFDKTWVDLKLTFFEDRNQDQKQERVQGIEIAQSFERGV